MTDKYIPLNDYVLIEVQAEEETELVNPDRDEDLSQTGVVVDPGKHGPVPGSIQTEHEFVSVGDEVEWVRFSGSGRTKDLPDGRKIAQIPFDRLTMKRSK